MVPEPVRGAALRLAIFQAKKTPGKNPGFSDLGGNNQLLDFAFLVHHMLTYNRIVLFHFQFVWSRTLVFVSCIEVACAS